MAHDYSDAGLEKLVADGIETEMTRQHMTVELTDEQRQNLKLRVPDMLFDHALVLNLGGVKCQILHVGGDHASDSSIMFVPEDRLLFLGDCLYPTVYELPGYYSRANIVRLYQRILGFNVEHFIEGHDDNVITRAELMSRVEKLRQVYRAIDRRGAGDYAALQAKFDGDEEALELLESAWAGVDV
jgi:glyoxylase-like metal-dependent hydrolase (beta-lactamase superfamily II)